VDRSSREEAEHSLMKLETQVAMRPLRKLPFCYLCGEPLDAGHNFDHVPPSTIFLPEDCNFPLILPTHVTCNGARSGDDESIGQVVGLLHGDETAKIHKLDIALTRSGHGALLVLLRDLDLRRIIKRWVRGFHAALYREYLPDGPQRFMTTPPLPEPDSEAPGRGFLPPHDVISEFTRIINRNRATRTVDSIICRNGRCRYECVWAQADGGQWACVYWLDLYDWSRLGADDNYGPRECVGAYWREGGGVPAGASRTTKLLFEL
jgi:hypothetical protein